MSEDLPSKLVEIVQKQLQQLKNHTHIQQIITIRPLIYKVQYWPQNLESVYSQKVYRLKLSIPYTYPENPPFLTFLDKIYHLNVHPISGQVSIAILKEDWSPFLNLNTVFDSLDQALEDPDCSFPATHEILDQYENDIETYIFRVKQFLGPSQNKTPQSPQRTVNNHERVSIEQVIQQLDSVRQIDYSKLANNQKVSVENIEREKPTINRIKSQEKLLKANQNGGQNFTSFQQKHQQIRVANSNINQYSSIQNYEQVIKQSKILDSSKPHSFDLLKLTMIRCKDLTKILSEQLDELQIQVEKTRSKRLKKIMQQRCNKVQQMLVQLFDASHKINSKVMDMLRRDIKKVSFSD